MPENSFYFEGSVPVHSFYFEGSVPEWQCMAVWYNYSGGGWRWLVFPSLQSRGWLSSVTLLHHTDQHTRPHMGLSLITWYQSKFLSFGYFTDFKVIKNHWDKWTWQDQEQPLSSLRLRKTLRQKIWRYNFAKLKLQDLLIISIFTINCQPNLPIRKINSTLKQVWLHSWAEQSVSRLKLENNKLKIFQSVSCDEFLHKLFHNDATLDEGTVPDIKVMDTDINMMSNDVNTNSLLDFFNQITSKSSSSLSGVPIKEEPLTEEDLKAFQKDRQKKDNHNLSELHIL